MNRLQHTSFHLTVLTQALSDLSAIFQVNRVIFVSLVKIRATARMIQRVHKATRVCANPGSMALSASPIFDLVK